MGVLLYHYTSTEGYSGILQSGYVRTSRGRGARYGKRVYLTIKDPRHNRATNIAENNFDGAWKYGGRINKVQIALGFSFDASEVSKLPVYPGDVWMYTSGNLPLEDYFTGCVFRKFGTGYTAITKDPTENVKQGPRRIQALLRTTSGVKQGSDHTQTSRRTRSDVLRESNIQSHAKEQSSGQVQTQRRATSDVWRENVKQSSGQVQPQRRTTPDVLRENARQSSSQVQTHRRATSNVWCENVKQSYGQVQTQRRTTPDVLRENAKHSSSQVQTQQRAASDVWRENVKQSSGQVQTQRRATSDVLRENVKQSSGQAQTPRRATSGVLRENVKQTSGQIDDVYGDVTEKSHLLAHDESVNVKKSDTAENYETDFLEEDRRRLSTYTAYGATASESTSTKQEPIESGPKKDSKMGCSCCIVM